MHPSNRHLRRRAESRGQCSRDLPRQGPCRLTREVLRRSRIPGDGSPGPPRPTARQSPGPRRPPAPAIPWAPRSRGPRRTLPPPAGSCPARRPRLGRPPRRPRATNRPPRSPLSLGHRSPGHPSPNRSPGLRSPRRPSVSIRCPHRCPRCPRNPPPPAPNPGHRRLPRIALTPCPRRSRPQTRGPRRPRMEVQGRCPRRSSHWAPNLGRPSPGHPSPRPSPNPDLSLNPSPGLSPNLRAG
jgi:hypothetical protein